MSLLRRKCSEAQAMKTYDAVVLTRPTERPRAKLGAQRGENGVEPIDQRGAILG